MKDFLWYFRCMIFSFLKRKQHEAINREYEWYKYLVLCYASSFFNRFFKSKNNIPF